LEDSDTAAFDSLACAVTPAASFAGSDLEGVQQFDMAISNLFVLHIFIDRDTSALRQINFDQKRSRSQTILNAASSASRITAR
jgi:hypothetical protein